MKPSTIDPGEQAFIQGALAAAARAQRWANARVIVATVVAGAAVIWFASKPASPELGLECTILIMVAAMLGLVTAKLRSLIQRNTTLVLQAIAELQSRGES
ncbi:MAG: hypothetical protein U0Q16_20905 [Bryobacteraceae bacterium]